MAKLRPLIDDDGEVRELTTADWQSRISALLAAHVKRASKRAAAK
jgi:hypothetical protein